MQDASNFPIPVYLNQKYCFDLLAMMENGLAQLETVRTTQTDQAERSSRFSGDLGLKDAFAFIGVKFGGERAGASQTGLTQEATIEKVHTPNSLFARVRKRLHDDELVKWSEVSQAIPGDFVEFSATMRKNPLVDALEGFKSIGELAKLFESNAQPRGNRGQQTSRQSGNSNDVLKQISLLLDQVNNGSLDLIATTVGEETLQVVLTMDRAFVGDPSLSDLVDGEYTVLGKVTKVIGDDSTSINLLRNTSLGRVSSQILGQLASSFEGAQEHGINLPTIVTEIKAPAIQIIPIAIFA